MNEHHLGYRVRQILNQDLALDGEKLARLKAAREQAIARQRVAAPGMALAWADNVSGGLDGGSASVFTRILLPAAMLILGFIAINTWQQSQAVQELVEIDSGVLTSDLPIDAYLDRGFDAWLKRSLP
jgi:hypothetical protein